MARLRRPEPEPAAAAEVPAELRDPGNRLWFDTAKYRAYMAAQQWRMPASDRLLVLESGSTEPPVGMPVSPVLARRRRMQAAVEWARTHGVAMSGRFVNYRRLRSLIGEEAA